MLASTTAFFLRQELEYRPWEETGTRVPINQHCLLLQVLKRMLGMSVVYESGWQHPADGFETYSSRGVAEAFLERVPTTWDQTEFLSGYPGRSATVARRSGAALEEHAVEIARAGPASPRRSATNAATENMFCVRR